MDNVFIELNVFIRAVLPFAAANIFALVLIYLTLIRHRIGEPYPYYALFIVSFIFFLSSPLVHITTGWPFNYWYATFKNSLLFLVGFPSLMCGLFILTKQPLSKNKRILVYSLGALWTIYFLIRRIGLRIEKGESLDFLYRNVITTESIFIASSVFVILVMVLPCIYLLINSREKATRITLIGALVLCIAVLSGYIFQQFVLMSFISAITVIAWCWTIFSDLKKTNIQLAHYLQHEKSLAKAQFVSSGQATFSDYYTTEKNIAYPLRERDALTEVVRTASAGVVNQHVTELFTALRVFCQHKHEQLKLHVRETLFILVDAAIYAGADAQQCTIRLDKKGAEINDSNNAQLLEKLLIKECYYLCQLIDNAEQQSPDDKIIEAVKSVIHAQYFNNISIADVAKAVHASQSHITRVFKSEMGYTIKQYLTEVRIEKAKILLLSKSVTESAFEAGFNDSNYFSTVFKKQTGCTPKQYQEQAKTV